MVLTALPGAREGPARRVEYGLKESVTWHRRQGENMEGREGEAFSSFSFRLAMLDSEENCWYVKKDFLIL